MNTSCCPRACLFDLDGTLIKFHKQFLFEETERLVLEYGINGASREVLNDCFCDFDYFRWVEPKESEDFIRFFWKQFNFASFPAPIPIQGVKQTLAQISGMGVPCYIVTARVSTKDKLEKELEHTGFLPFLSDIVCRPGDDVDWQDKKAMIQLACNMAGTEVKDAVMIGDIPSDIISAKEARVGTSVAVLSGDIREHVLAEAKPDYILPDVNSLLGVLF